MTPNRSVCIVGVGASTAVGYTAISSAAAVRAGVAAFSEHPYMVDKAGERMIVARASYIPDDSVGIERFLQLAFPAAQEALASLCGLSKTMPPIPVFIGLPSERPGLPAALGNMMAERFKPMMREVCSISSVETKLSGHSAGLMAIQVAWRNIIEGSMDFCLAGGVDSYLEAETLEWLDEYEQLHSIDNAWGFIPGEAAGFCLLSSRQAAERYRLNILGKVLVAATAREENLIKTKTVCIGQGLSETVKHILQSLPSPVAKVDQTICDMNGENYRADEFAFTIARTSERFVDAAEFQTPADCWGDVGAASGPLFITLAIAAGSKGYAKGPHTLVWTSSETGERSGALIHVNTQAGGER